VKPWVAALGVSAVLISASLGHSQQNCAALAKPAKSKFSAVNEIDKAPQKARARFNPLASDPEAAMAGRILFERHCTQCHGNAAEGGHHGPNLRAPEVQNATPGAIFWILTNGIVRHGMPVWSKLPEPQRWQLVSYIKSLGIKPTPESLSLARP
jgi:mono/diheme cytochrome c family protein